MAQKAFQKGVDSMLADESLEEFLVARGWVPESPAKPKPRSRGPKKPAAKKTAAPKQPDPGLDPITDAPRGDSTQEK